MEDGEHFVNAYFCSSSVAGHSYETRVGDSFVISANDALLSCSLPSYASEYLTIVAWVTSEGAHIAHSDTWGNVTASCFVD